MKRFLAILICWLAFSTLFAFHPCPSFGEVQYYTVQVGSYSDEQAALRNFLELEQAVAPEYLGFLRVERIRDFWVVRLGRFDDWALAGSLLELVRGKYPSSYVLRAFYRPARIQRLYEGSFGNPLVATDGDEAVEESAVLPSYDDGREYFTLQLASFGLRTRAEKKYEYFVRVLSPPARPYLRIELINGLYALRVGRFETEKEAANLKNRLPSGSRGVVLSAFIRKERLVRMDSAGIEAGEEGVLVPVWPAGEVFSSADPEGQKMTGAKILAPGEQAVFVEEDIVPVPEISVAEPLPATGTLDGPGQAEVVGSGVRGPDLPAGRPVELAGLKDGEKARASDSVSLPLGDLPVDDDFVWGREDAVPEDSTPAITGRETGGVGPLRIFEEESDAPKGLVPPKVVSVVVKDDNGDRIGFPGRIYYDAVMEEAYLIVGKGSGSVVLYGADYFPYSSLGTGRGVDSPRALVVSGDGKLIVAQGGSDKHEPRLSILNAAFFPEREVKLAEIAGGEDFMPEQVALGRDNTVYLLGAGVPGVIVLDRQGGFQRWWQPVDPDFASQAKEGFAPGTIEFRDLVVDRAGRIFLLSEENSRVYVFSPEEELLYSFGKKGGSSGKMSRARGLAVDELRKCVYVADYLRHTILVYRWDGEFIFEFGGFGNAPGWFQYPVDVEIGRGGNVLVSDLFNHRMQVFEVR